MRRFDEDGFIHWFSQEDKMLKFLFEENDTFTFICKCYCKAIAIVISISLPFCL